MIKFISSSRFTHVYFDPSSHDRLCVSGLQSTQQDHPDIFADLGPVYFFNAMCALVERRTHTVMISETDGFGLRLSGGNPVRVSDVVYGGPAAAAGMKCGDYIIEIGDVDVRSRLASEVEAELVKAAAAGGVAKIVVVVNYDMQNFEELINPEMPSGVTAHVDTLAIPSTWNTIRGSGGAAFSLAGKSPFKIDEDLA